MQQWRILQRDVFPLLTTANHASIDSLEKAYNDKLTAEVGAAVVARSQAFGDSVASAIFNWAKSDLFDHVNDPYIIKVFLVHGFQRLPCFRHLQALTWETADLSFKCILMEQHYRHLILIQQ